MRVRFARRKGGALIQVVMALAALFGFAALTTDYGLMAVRQARLQNAADSAALAAGPEMFQARSDRAIDAAMRVAESNDVPPEAIQFDWVDPYRLRVTAWDDVPAPFLGAMNRAVETRRVSAIAEVEATTPMAITMTSKLRPWGIPIAFFNPMGESPIEYDDNVTLYLVENANEQPGGVPDNSYFIQPFALSQDRKDATDGPFPNYTHDVKFGYDRPITATKKKSEPGYADSFMWSQPGDWNAILGATYQAVVSAPDSMMRRASENPAFQNDTADSHSPDNPRLIFLPIYDRAIFGAEVRARILGFTAFYVEGMTDNAITGRFVRFSLPYDGRTLNPVTVQQLYSGIIQFRLVK